jgi:hypothetical protein
MLNSAHVNSALNVEGECVKCVCLSVSSAHVNSALNVNGCSECE